jgi:predicted MFS family arabinose efflux permease
MVPGCTERERRNYESEIDEIGAQSVANNHNMPWGTVLRSANLQAILLCGFCYVFALYFFISWLHTFLVKGRGFTEADLLLSIAPGLLGAAGNLCGGFLSDALVRRLGMKWDAGCRLIGLSVATLCTCHNGNYRKVRHAVLLAWSMQVSLYSRLC